MNIDDTLNRLDRMAGVNETARVAAAQIRRLRLLCIRKSEALAIVASPSMWHVLTHWDDVKGFHWNGESGFADPMAWAKMESEATDAN